MCGWTDIALDSAYDVNELYEAQRCYAKTGASESDARVALRAAQPGEERPTDWSPLPGVAEDRSRRDESRDRVVAAIRAAFADVSPEGRISLTQAYRADYDLPPSGEVGEEWSDYDERWSQIPAEVIDYFAVRTGVFTFGNEVTFHYYLPAYMVRDLETRTLYAAEALAQVPTASLALLDEPQRAAARAYLQHSLDFDGPDDRAERALARLAGRAPR